MFNKDKKANQDNQSKGNKQERQDKKPPQQNTSKNQKEEKAAGGKN
ncbi:MAG: hypothetical protein JKY71_03635 [Alphaproteobacteria bacterium]|nr:hypothetical protein [Alphaproteobacteria bacterium]